MKKTALATSVLLVAASNSVTAAEVFNNEDAQLNINGRVVGMYYFSDDNNIDSDKSHFRVGLDGRTQVSDSLYGFGRYVLEHYADSVDTFDTRQAYAGIGSEIGELNNELTYGRQYGSYSLVANFTDVLYEFGNEASGAGTDQFGTGRSDSVLKYAASYQDLYVNVSYQLENDLVIDGSGSTAKTDATSYGVAATYALPMNISIGAAYNEGEGQENASDSEMAAFAISFNNYNIYAAVLYTTGENWEKDGSESGADYEGYEAVLGYDFGNGLSVLSGYNHLETEKSGLSTEDVVDYYTLGMQYRFDSRLQTFVEYKVDDIEDSEDVIALALRYDF